MSVHALSEKDKWKLSPTMAFAVNKVFERHADCACGEAKLFLAVVQNAISDLSLTVTLDNRSYESVQNRKDHFKMIAQNKADRYSAIRFLQGDRVTWFLLFINVEQEFLLDLLDRAENYKCGDG